MEALWDIRQRGHLIENEATRSAVDAFRRSSNTTAQFLADQFTFGADLRVPRSSLWPAFKAWSEDKRAGRQVRADTFRAAVRSDPRLTESKIGGTYYVVGLAPKSTT